MSPATVSSLSTPPFAGVADLERLAQTAASTPSNGGMTAFLGFTVLVLAGFLVLARLSQRVVDEEGERSDGLQVPADRPPETRWSGPERDEPAERERSGPGPGDAEPTGPASPEPSDRSRFDPDESVSSPAIERRSSDGASGNAPPGTASPGNTPGRATPGEPSVSPAVLLANVALTQGLFGGVLAAAAWFFQVPGTALGLAGGRVEGFAAVGVGLAFGVALWGGNELASALVDAAGAGYDEGLRRMLAPGNARGWAVLLGGVLPVIALVEEFLFRAAAVGAASTTLGATPALAVASSLAFALGHGAQGRVGVVVTGVLGFVLAAGFVVSGSFVVVVVAHYVVNALEFLLHEWVGLPDPVWS